VNRNFNRRQFLAVVPPSLLLATAKAEDKPMTTDLDAVSAANAAFGTDLYKLLAGKPGNQFLSPFSIGTTLAMTAVGAKGTTRTAMLKALRLPDGAGAADRGYAELLPKINGAGIEPAKRGYALDTANDLWAQTGVAWLAEFRTKVTTEYAAGIHNLDFAGATEDARKTINAAVEKRTRDKIKNLLRPGILTRDTRLVLTNAVYFKGDWLTPFEKRRTQDADFTRADGKKIKVPLMSQTEAVPYAETEDYQVVRLPYAGRQTAMTIVLPRKPDGLTAVEGKLTAEWFAALSASLKLVGEIQLALPRFKIEADYELAKPLADLGMALAFSPQADFGGMSASERLMLSQVVHKAYVDVNEVGTEAAAATGAVMRPTSVPIRQKVFRADRPFLFAVEHLPTKSLLFLGRFDGPKA